MEKELTIEHIAPYLPYGLKCQVTDKGELKIATLNAIYTDNTYVFSDIIESEQGFEDIKPILRPLSDLTKEIEHNGERFVPIVELFQLSYQDIYEHRFNGDTTILSSKYLAAQFQEDGWSYGFTVELPTQFQMTANGDQLTISNFDLYQKLFQWHFDTQGLIDSGLAININEINQPNKD